MSLSVSLVLGSTLPWRSWQLVREISDYSAYGNILVRNILLTRNFWSGYDVPKVKLVAAILPGESTLAFGKREAFSCFQWLLQGQHTFALFYSLVAIVKQFVLLFYSSIRMLFFSGYLINARIKLFPMRAAGCTFVLSSGRGCGQRKCCTCLPQIHFLFTCSSCEAVCAVLESFF